MVIAVLIPLSSVLDFFSISTVGAKMTHLGALEITSSVTDFRFEGDLLLCTIDNLDEHPSVETRTQYVLVMDWKVGLASGGDTSLACIRVPRSPGVSFIICYDCHRLIGTLCAARYAMDFD